MKRLAIRLAVLVGSTLACLGAAELLYRVLGPAPDRGALYYADADRVEVDLEKPADLQRAMQLVEAIPGAPRPRLNFKPGVLVHLGYRGYAGQDGFDERGCIPFRINSWGIRDREELCTAKPEGQTRVVCIGDSTTVGWGVRIEDAWPRRIERILRARDDAIRVVNCGAAGALLPDEYAYGLETRFGRFEPDAVLVTLCMNDLLPVNGGMAQFDPDALAAAGRPLPPWLGWSRMVSDLVRASRMRNALRLDPARDWVGELLALPTARYPTDSKAVGRVYWDSGVPQQSLRRMRDWCRERGVRFAVEIWPFLQQLESRTDYPFRPMHEKVAALCGEEGIPFLDLLDAFIGMEPSELWVTPKDMHGNARAHELAAPRIAAFVERVLHG